MIKHFLTLSLLFTSWVQAEKPVPDVADAFEVEPGIIISAQPTTEDMEVLKEYGIKAVINSRTDAEMDLLDFNEQRWWHTADVGYSQVAIGSDEPYSVAKLTAFNEAMEAAREQAGDQPILLHCRSGHRSSQLYAAWLVKYKNHTPNEAFAKVAPKDRLLHPMEKLLNQKLMVRFADEATTTEESH